MRVDMADVRRAHGGHFFDRGALRFFRSRIAQTGVRRESDGVVYFVTSEQFQASNGYRAPRAYTVRRWDPATDDVSTVGPFNVWTRATAHRCATGLASRDVDTPETVRCARCGDETPAGFVRGPAHVCADCR